MKIVVKHFHDLTTQELYNILQLRSEVFVVEQECIYQDIDGKDQNAIHVFFTENLRRKIIKKKMFVQIFQNRIQKKKKS